MWMVVVLRLSAIVSATRGILAVRVENGRSEFFLPDCAYRSVCRNGIATTNSSADRKKVRKRLPRDRSCGECGSAATSEVLYMEYIGKK
jgi:hypothetical protein